MDLSTYPIFSAVSVDRAAPVRDPSVGEQTYDQNQYRAIGDWCGVNSNLSLTVDNPLRVSCGTPLWEYTYTQSYATYRLMRCHPTIALARSIVMAPIIASEWSMDVRRDTPEAWVEWAKRYILPLRKQIVQDSLRALDYGHANFEVVWAIDEGRMIPARFKALAVDQNEILIDPHGNFAGIRPSNSGADRSKDLGPEKSWLYTYDGEFGDLVGRSRLENLRRGPWSNWWDTAHKMRKLREKLSGILPIIYHPPGAYTDKNGTLITYQSQALKALKNLADGKGITLENLGFNTEDVKMLMQSVKTSLTHVDFYDAGPAASGQEGFLSTLAYDDAQMMRGYLRPERVALEGSHGTKAESQVQGEASIYDAEVLDDSICDQVNPRTFDQAMMLNFGEAARGAIKVKPSPLVDRKIAAYREVMASLLKFPELATVIAQNIDLKQIFDFFDVKTDDDFKERVKELKIADPTANPPTSKPGGDAPRRVNGASASEPPIIRQLLSNLLQNEASNAG